MRMMRWGEDGVPSSDDRVGTQEHFPPLLHASPVHWVTNIIAKLHHAYLGLASKMVAVVDIHEHDAEFCGFSPANQGEVQVT